MADSVDAQIAALQKRIDNLSGNNSPDAISRVVQLKQQMADLQNGKRFGELTKKQAAGKLSPAEFKEMQGLMAKAPEQRPDNTPLPTQKDFDAMKAQAAAAENVKRQNAAMLGPSMIGGSPAAQAAIPSVKPSDIQVNPDLIQDLKYANDQAPNYAIVNLKGPEGAPAAQPVATQPVAPPTPALASTPSVPVSPKAAPAAPVETPIPVSPAPAATAPTTISPDVNGEEAPSKRTSFDLKSFGRGLAEIINAGALGKAGVTDPNALAINQRLAREERDKRATQEIAQKQADRDYDSKMRDLQHQWEVSMAQAKTAEERERISKDYQFRASQADKDRAVQLQVAGLGRGAPAGGWTAQSLAGATIGK